MSQQRLEQNSTTSPAEPAVRGDGSVVITVADDRMTARALFTPAKPGGQPVTRGYVERILSNQGITHGLAWEEIDAAVAACGEGDAQPQEIVIARGTPPSPQVRSHFALHPGFAAVRELIEEAARNPADALHHAHGLPIAFAGQPVAELQAERPGQPGTDVFGAQVRYQEQTPDLLRPGKNTRLEGDRIVAAKSGLLQTNNGEVSIERDLTLACDLDNSTGNISFPGNLSLSGTVHDRFRLWVGGDLQAKDTLDASEVFCRGQLTAAGGIIGKGRALVRSRGKVRAKFVESCTVESKSSVYVENFCYNARILALDRLVMGKHGKIVGGEVRTAHGVTADEIGNRAEIETRIVVGGDFVVERKLQAARARIEKLQAAIDRLDNRLASKPSARLKERRLRLAEKRYNYTVILENLVGKLDRNEQAEVTARSVVHAGTVIEICRATVTVEETLGPSRFRLDTSSGRIVVEDPNTAAEEEIG